MLAQITRVGACKLAESTFMRLLTLVQRTDVCL
jgi:hypothetical protein